MSSAGEILEQLDHPPKRWDFPVMDHPADYMAATRLTCFGDIDHWAMSIEQLVFAPNAAGCDKFRLWIYTYGNSLIGLPGAGHGDAISPIREGIDGPLFEGYTDIMRPNVQTVHIRNQLVSFELTLGELEKYKIQPIFSTRNNISLRLCAADLLRLFAAKYRGLVLATNAERRKRIALPLPQLLQLDEWHHPDIMGGEKPSDTQCFRSLAEALAESDPSLYRPTEPPNTDWRNWPRAGML